MFDVYNMSQLKYDAKYTTAKFVRNWFPPRGTEDRYEVGRFVDAFYGVRDIDSMRLILAYRLHFNHKNAAILAEYHFENLVGLHEPSQLPWPMASGEINLAKQHRKKPHHVEGLSGISDVFVGWNVR